MEGIHLLAADIEKVIADRSASQRAQSLRRVTDLFLLRAADYTEEQLALFDDVLARLIADIESSARALLATRLAPVPNAPRGIVETLAFDQEIEVARPILIHSHRLSEEALVRNASTMSQQHLLAISRRKTLAEAVTDVLVERGDEIVVLKTVKNKGARFSESGFGTLVGRARGNDTLAASIGARPELPRHHFLKLLSVASQSVRAALERQNPQAVAEIRKVVDEVTAKVQQDTVAHSYDYRAAMDNVLKISSKGELRERDIARLATEGNFAETVVALSQVVDVPIAVVEGALTNPRAELLLLIMKAIGLEWRTAKAILQLRTQTHASTPLDLDQCLASYEQIKPKTAEQAVRFHRGRGSGRA
jgi:uncharacterized protein (DUF2336 family)